MKFSTDIIILQQSTNVESLTYKKQDKWNQNYSIELRKQWSQDNSNTSYEITYIVEKKESIV